MRFIAPQLKGEGCDHIRVAEDQEEYLTLPAAIVRHPGYNNVPCHMLCLRLDTAEKLAIAEGADIYINLLSFGKALQPILVLIGKETAASAFGLEPEE